MVDSLMRMKKIKQHHLFFDNNYKLSTGEVYQYIIDCFPFMKFANLDSWLYQYRQDSTQTTASTKNKSYPIFQTIIRKSFKIQYKNRFRNHKIFFTR